MKGMGCLTRIDIGAILDQFAHVRGVPVRDCHGVMQRLGESKRQTDLVRAQVRVWGNYRAATVVDSLAHHILSEKALFPLQKLSDATRSRVFAESVGSLG